MGLHDRPCQDRAAGLDGSRSRGVALRETTPDCRTSARPSPPHASGEAPARAWGRPIREYQPDVRPPSVFARIESPARARDARCRTSARPPHASGEAPARAWGRRIRGYQPDHGRLPSSRDDACTRPAVLHLPGDLGYPTSPSRDSAPHSGLPMIALQEKSDRSDQLCRHVVRLAQNVERIAGCAAEGVSATLSRAARERRCDGCQRAQATAGALQAALPGRARCGGDHVAGRRRSRRWGELQGRHRPGAGRGRAASGDRRHRSAGVLGRHAAGSLGRVRRRDRAGGGHRARDPAARRQGACRGRSRFPRHARHRQGRAGRLQEHPAAFRA